MPLDESDTAENKKTRPRHRAVWAILFLLLPLSLCVLPGLQIIEPEKPRPDSTRLESVEYICSYLSLPEKFVFVEKTSFTGAAHAEVSYKYKSERSFEEIEPHFVVWLSSNDWEREAGEALKFQRKKYAVTIEKVDFSHYNYVINCTETE
jgi:hypothetical protein